MVELFDESFLTTEKDNTDEIIPNTARHIYSVIYTAYYVPIPVYFLVSKNYYPHFHTGKLTVYIYQLSYGVTALPEFFSAED
jgi:hypothetical protein